MSVHVDYLLWPLPAGSTRAVRLKDVGDSRAVNLYRKKGTEKDWLQLLQNNEHLIHIAIRGLCNQVFLDAATSCPNLRQLHIDNGRNLDVSALADLSQLAALGYIGSVKEFSVFFNATRLMSAGFGITKHPMDFSALNDSHWPSLRTLSLFGSGFVSRQTVTGLEGLSKLASLEALTFGKPTKKSDFELGKLASSKTLKCITLPGRRAWPKAELEKVENAGIEIEVY